MRTEEEQREWQLQAYGCSEEDLWKSVQRSFGWPGATRTSIVTSILSDVQEEIARGLNETARQELNCAKWILNNVTEDGKRIER
jgi:hypothetical protein